jgi:peptidoglycan/xylan/chitin deacetylase (PgdA/CDA1 family)
MTVRPEDGFSRRGLWGSWAGRTRVLWVLCAVAYGVFLIRFLWFARASIFTEWEQAGAIRGPDKIIVSFRNDDLSLYSNPALEDSVLSIFKAHGVRQTFAFIPNPAGYIGGITDQPPANSGIVELLRRWERDGLIEFALHGFTHLKNGVGGGEFDGLSVEAQTRMMREGKAILDSTLGTNVRIFVPPWNQADEHTLEACSRSGIDMISGYIGTPPAPGIIAVNTNAELFYHQGEIPPVDRVLELARSGSGTRFVSVFYHSRVDFQSAESFRSVDSLLTALRSDARVEILSLGEIARRYPAFLMPYSGSGWNIIEGEKAMRFAKPYLGVFSHLPFLGEKVRDLERRHERALESYWCGDYHAARLQAGTIVKQSGYLLALGRLVSPLGVGIVLGLLLLAHAGRKSILFVYSLVIIPLLLSLLVLAIWSHISPERLEELVRLAVVFVGGLLLVLPWLPQMGVSSTRRL